MVFLIYQRVEFCRYVDEEVAFAVKFKADVKLWFDYF